MIPVIGVARCQGFRVLDNSHCTAQPVAVQFRCSCVNLLLVFSVQNLKLVQNVEELAEKKGVTPGQLALAWVIAQGDDVIHIPGTKRISCVDENVAAAFVKLTAEEVKELEDAVPHHEV